MKIPPGTVTGDTGSVEGHPGWKLYAQGRM